MKKSDIAFITSAVFVTCASFFYLIAIVCKVPVPRYYPLESVWKMTSIKGVPSQGWYGLQMVAFIAAGIVALAAYFVLKNIFTKKPLNLSPAAHKIISLLTMLVILCSMGYILFHEFSVWGILNSAGV